MGHLPSPQAVTWAVVLRLAAAVTAGFHAMRASRAPQDEADRR